MTRQNRRQFLRNASALSLASLGGVGTALTGFQRARAADTSGYKALVCLFLFGGLDNHDTLLPYDVASYNQYAAIRAPLLSQYGAMAGGSTRDRARLLPLTPDNAADFGGREFALTEEMAGIHGLFQSGDAAIVGNVGPLIEPLTRTEWEAETATTPKRLFSHNDQQSTWMSGAPEGGSAFGWGGLFADAALASFANADEAFTAISSFDSGLFLTGQQARPYQIGTRGAAEIGILEEFEDNQFLPELQLAYQNMRAHFAASNHAGANLIERDMASAIGASLLTNESYNAALESAPTLATAFPDSFLGGQLRAVAEAISVRNVLLAGRQVFFVGIGGFDTHSNQAQDLPALQTTIDAAVTAFFAAMQELGVSSDVTLFTASDFGRTLAINGDGTDHGWGAHHFVVGGAVQGRNIYGSVPVADFDHDQDAGGGRLIPTTSIEQFAEPLGRWFGLDNSEIATALPNLGAFGAPPLTYV